MNDNDIDEKIKNLDLFLGSLEEYVQYKRQDGTLSEGDIIEFMPPMLRVN